MRPLLRQIWQAHLELQNAEIARDLVRMDIAETSLRRLIESIPSVIGEPCGTCYGAGILDEPDNTRYACPDCGGTGKKGGAL